MQVGIVLEKDPRVGHLDPKEAGRDCLLQVPRWGLGFHTGYNLSTETSKPTPIAIHFL